MYLFVFDNYSDILTEKISLIEKIFNRRKGTILYNKNKLKRHKKKLIYVCGNIINKELVDLENFKVIKDASENYNLCFETVSLDEIEKSFFVFGPDSYINYDLKINLDFEKIIKSYNWTTMQQKGNNVPRLVCIQYKKTDIGIPIYRHPIDKQPFYEPYNEVTEYLANFLNKILGYDFNHVLIQRYRNGNDFIGEHSDKTLDIIPNTPIINISFGATRYLTLKNKVNEEKYDIALENKSMFVLGLKTNNLYYHMIKQDKREIKFKRDDETLCNGERISFTFRCIGTYLNNDLLVGLGAPKYNKEDINYNKEKINDEEDMFKAFSVENKTNNFDRNIYYKKGFFSY